MKLYSTIQMYRFFVYAEMQLVIVVQWAIGILPWIAVVVQRFGSFNRLHQNNKENFVVCFNFPIARDWRQRLLLYSFWWIACLLLLRRLIENFLTINLLATTCSCESNAATNTANWKLYVLISAAKPTTSLVMPKQKVTGTKDMRIKPFNIEWQY